MNKHQMWTENTTNKLSKYAKRRANSWYRKYIKACSAEMSKTNNADQNGTNMCLINENPKPIWWDPNQTASINEEMETDTAEVVQAPHMWLLVMVRVGTSRQVAQIHPHKPL